MVNVVLKSRWVVRICSAVTLQGHGKIHGPTYVEDTRLTLRDIGTSSSECVIASGCNRDFGACWLPGEQSFRPLSEVFPSATDTSACPTALLPGPSDGPEIAQPPGTTDPAPPPGQTSSSGMTIPPLIPVQTPPPGGPPDPSGPPTLPNIPRPRLCLILCDTKLPKWKIDLSCRGPLCKHIGPRRGCSGVCDLLKCLFGCEKKGGGTITNNDKPPHDPGMLIGYLVIRQAADFAQMILPVLMMMNLKRHQSQPQSQTRKRKRKHGRHRVQTHPVQLNPRVNAKRPRRRLRSLPCATSSQRWWVPIWEMIQQHLRPVQRVLRPRAESLKDVKSRQPRQRCSIAARGNRLPPTSQSIVRSRSRRA
jgi:hypothetical protein